MTSSRPSLAVSLLALLLLAASASTPRSAEDCSDLSRIPDCPPVSAGCTDCVTGMPIPCVPQDCSTCTPGCDDDGDCVIDEELLNGIDDDGDMRVDEDISCLNTCSPLNYGCSGGTFDTTLTGVPHPIDSVITLPARVKRYDCTGTESFLSLELSLRPDVVTTDSVCGGYRAIVTLADMSGTTTYYEGPAVLVHTRRYESLEETLLSPDATGNVQIFRYALRADLGLSGDFDALPMILQAPCMSDATGFPDFHHLFMYGHFDLALDAENPSNRRHSLVLHHARSSLSHPPAVAGEFCEGDTVTGRPIQAPTDPGSHEDGWLVVAPSDIFVFNDMLPVVEGDMRYGKIREVGIASTTCGFEWRSCVSQWEVPSFPLPETRCADAEVDRNVRFCGNLAGTSGCVEHALSSDTRCNTIPGDLIGFFPVGSWTGGLFPGGMDVSVVEGALSCVPPPTMADPYRPYWYGSATSQASGAKWLGPEDAIDLVNNLNVGPGNPNVWLIGALPWQDEGTMEEEATPNQSRVLYFFPDQNPEIPVLTPCVADAVITPPAPAACAGTTPVTVCLGDDLVLSGECSTVENCCQCGRLQYQWSRWDGSTWVIVQPFNCEDPTDCDTKYTESPGPTVTTDYKLEVRCSTSKTACVAEATTTVTVAPKPTAAPSATPSTVCAGESVTLAANASCPVGPCECTWSASVGSAPTATCASQTVTPTATTTYTLVVRDTGTGCESAPSNVTVTVNDPPAGTASASPTAICAGDSSTLSVAVTCPIGPCDCDWSASVAPDPADTCASQAVSPASTTNYTVVVTDTATGCKSPASAVTVTVTPSPTATPTVTPTVGCAGDIFRLDAGACAGCTCSWTASVPPAPPAVCTVDVGPTADTTYTVVVTDPMTGCSSPPTPVDVVVNSVTADAGPDRVECYCTTATKQLEGTGGATNCMTLEYRWREVGGSWLCGNDATWLPASPTPPEFPCTIVEGCAGTYELQVRCVETNCSASDRITITITPEIDPSTCTIQSCATLTPAQKIGDDDGDQSTNEELPNGLDDDGDGCIDEDIDCTVCADRMHFDGCRGYTGGRAFGTLPDGDIATASWLTWDAMTGAPTTLATGSVTWTAGSSTCELDEATLELVVGSSVLVFDATLVYSRGWQVPDSSLVPGAGGDVCVERYLVRAELETSIGTIPVPPCFSDFGKVFFTGHLDVARACDDPSLRRHALVLTHSMGELSHCSASARPLGLGSSSAHVVRGWTLVAPSADPGVSFAFDAGLSPPSGSTAEETQRMNGFSGCSRERPIRAASLSTPAAVPPFVSVTATDASIDGLNGACGCELVTSDATCGVGTDSLLAISLGQWTGPVFPGALRVHHVEGGIEIESVAGPEAGYVYGTATTVPPAGPPSAGPPELVDLIDNRTYFVWEQLIGAKESWRHVYGLFGSYSPDHAVTCP